MTLMAIETSRSLTADTLAFVLMVGTFQPFCILLIFPLSLLAFVLAFLPDGCNWLAVWVGLNSLL